MSRVQRIAFELFRIPAVDIDVVIRELEMIQETGQTTIDGVGTFTMMESLTGLLDGYGSSR